MYATIAKMKRTGVCLLASILGFATPLAAATAADESKLTSVVKIKDIEGARSVFYNATTKSYLVVIQPGGQPNIGDWLVFYGTAKTMYQQLSFAFSGNGSDEWSISLRAPRAKHGATATFMSTPQSDIMQCGVNTGVRDLKSIAFSKVGRDEAAKLVANATFRSNAIVRAPLVLARDDSGVYYYVDQLREQYGGEAYRVFVGRKGAMRLTSLVDAAVDKAGMVFATKSGDLRLSVNAETKQKAATLTWTARSKAIALHSLEPGDATYLIYRELGVYGFLGTVCDDL